MIANVDARLLENKSNNFGSLNIKVQDKSLEKTSAVTQNLSGCLSHKIVHCKGWARVLVSHRKKVYCRDQSVLEVTDISLSTSSSRQRGLHPLTGWGTQQDPGLASLGLLRPWAGGWVGERSPRRVPGCCLASRSTLQGGRNNTEGNRNTSKRLTFHLFPKGIPKQKHGTRKCDLPFLALQSAVWSSCLLPGSLITLTTLSRPQGRLDF